MKLIAHRGNISGIDSERENSPDYIDEAISQGYDVEIDAWYDTVLEYFYSESKDYLFVHLTNTN